MSTPLPPLPLPLPLPPLALLYSSFPRLSFFSNTPAAFPIMFSLDSLCFCRATSMHSTATTFSALTPVFVSKHPLAGTPLFLSNTVDGHARITAAHVQYSRFKGLRETRGRWEACIEEGSRQAKLLFASEEEAAKAYDKAQYKLYGDEAVTNFDLSENEKEEVMELEWEDLVLNLQLRGLPKVTLCDRPDLSRSPLQERSLAHSCENWQAALRGPL